MYRKPQFSAGASSHRSNVPVDPSTWKASSEE